MVGVDVRKGVHVAASKSVTVIEAGNNWLTPLQESELERATLKTYAEQLAHIAVHIGSMKLSAISVPTVPPKWRTPSSLRHQSARCWRRRDMNATCGLKTK